MEKFLGWGMSVIAVVFSLSVLWYLYKNDFSKETLEPMYPMLGIVAVSFFLYAKLIWIDAPAPQTYETTITILQNLSTGRAYSVQNTFSHSTHNYSPFSVDGIVKMEQNTQGNLFKSIRDAREFGNISDGEILLTPLEYTLLTWLSKYQRPSWVNRDTASTGILSSMRSSQSLVPEQLNQGYPLHGNRGDEYDKFLTNNPIQIKFPRNSRIFLDADKRTRSIRIESDTSIATLKIEYIGGNSIRRHNSSLARTVFREKKIRPQKGVIFYEHNYRLSWAMDTNKLYRFSTKAKYHKEWFLYVQRGLELDFSNESVISIINTKNREKNNAIPN